MESRKSEEVLKVLERYVPIKANIKSFSIEKVPEYMAMILKNDEKLEAFLQYPEKELQDNGIKPEEVDVPLFTELTMYLKGRQGVTNGGPMITSPKKTKDKGAQWDFENKRSWFMKKESAWLHERGRSEKKEKEELLETKKDFDEKTKKRGTGFDPIVLMNPKLRANFFPAQPLVTPELLEEIKTILDM